MFLSMTTWVTGIGEAVGGVAVGPDWMTIVMAVVAATLGLGVVLIMGEWLHGRIMERRHAGKGRRTTRPHWRARLGGARHRGA